MALIDCPECGAQVSDKAPTCPKCGVPIAGAPQQSSAAAPATQSDTNPSGTAAEPAPLPTERSAEPFRIAGRRVPIAALLFWGGMVLGVILKAAAPEGEETPFRYVPFFMIFAGILWFSVTEFVMLMRYRKRRH